MNKLHAYPNNNLSKKLNGRNVNWFPNGKSLATTIAESVEVSIYGIKPSSVPTESIPGGFGYGTLFVVGGRGDEGYGYGYAIYSGSNAAGSRVFATYDNNDSGWSERVSKSDLFAYNWISNPNTCTTPFAVVNGWSHDFANAPDDARNTWNSLQTTWVYPSEIGDLTKQRLQILITGNNTLHTRMYANGSFANWS